MDTARLQRRRRSSQRDFPAVAGLADSGLGGMDFPSSRRGAGSLLLAHFSTNVYEPRCADEELVYRIAAAESHGFLGEAKVRSHPLPSFVESTFRGFLTCGIPERGFLRVHCDGCGRDRVVPFSRKRRGVCNSCGGRWMAETAANLVDSVLPAVPTRQRLLSLPLPLRYRLAYDRTLATPQLAAFLRAVFASLRRRAREAQGVRNTRCGAVTFLQRFGGALDVTDACAGLQHERRGAPNRLFVSAAMDPGDPVVAPSDASHHLDPYRCYRVSATTKAPKHFGRWWIHPSPQLLNFSLLCGEHRDVGQIPWSSGSALVPYEVLSAETRNHQTLDGEFDTILPRGIEVDPGDGREEINAAGRQTDLIDEIGSVQILQCQVEEWRPKSNECLPDSTGVLGSGSHPKIEISGGTRHSVDSQCVGADQKEISAGRAQRGQHLDEVAVHGELLP